jgi:glycosyltransferase involved in cell wall biosynthesis
MLTVLIATRNRARLLSRVLEYFCALEEPSSGWKLVVVDNGSTDDTGRVLASFASRLPLHTLVETTPGKNSALNAGIEIIEGDLAVFTDDDVFPRPDWLVQLRNAADRHTECTIFGGPIVPRWEAPPPRWVGWVELGPVFSITDSNLTEGEIPPVKVFGPNMVVRSHIFHSGVRFNPEIGPRGTDYAMGSESELTIRLEGVGQKAWFVPQAPVEHFIRKEQFKTSWVMARAYRYGRGDFRLFHMRYLDARSAQRHMDIPRPLIREFIGACGDLSKALLSFRWETIFRACYQINFLRGRAAEARRAIQHQRISRLGGDLRVDHPIRRPNAE